MVLFISLCEYVFLFLFSWPRGYVRYFGHASCINAVFLSCTSPHVFVTHFVYLSLYRCFLFLPCGLRIRLNILFVSAYGHGFLFLHVLKDMLENQVIPLWLWFPLHSCGLRCFGHLSVLTGPFLLHCPWFGLDVPVV
jgi:hypothetical protein